MVEIDFRQLNPETLDNLLIEIVLREGTDYGEIEQSLEQKKNALHRRLNLGEAMIVYNSKEDFCDVVKK